MDVWKYIGLTLLVWLAYKLGVYVEGKMKAKQRELEAQKKDAAPGPEEKP